MRVENLSCLAIQWSWTWTRLFVNRCNMQWWRPCDGEHFWLDRHYPSVSKPRTKEGEEKSIKPTFDKLISGLGCLSKNLFGFLNGKWECLCEAHSSLSIWWTVFVMIPGDYLADSIECGKISQNSHWKLLQVVNGGWESKRDGKRERKRKGEREMERYHLIEWKPSNWFDIEQPIEPTGNCTVKWDLCEFMIIAVWWRQFSDAADSHRNAMRWHSKSTLSR